MNHTVKLAGVTTLRATLANFRERNTKHRRLGGDLSVISM